MVLRRRANCAASQHCATIREKIECGEAATVEEIGKLLRAGTNCGSCVPELKRIIATTPVRQPA